MTQKKQNLNSHPSGGRDLILLPLLRLYHMIEIYLSSVSDVICWPFSADPSRAGLRSRNQTRVISSQQQTLFSCLKQPPLMLRGKRRETPDFKDTLPNARPSLFHRAVRATVSKTSRRREHPTVCAHVTPPLRLM